MVLAVGAAATAEQIAPVLAADPGHPGRPGLRRRGLLRRADPARRGHGPRPGDRPDQLPDRPTSSRSRFGRPPQGDEDPLKGGRYAVESYLEHHGEKLVRRFDPNSYIVLSEAMNHHDVGPGRGGVAAALARCRAEVTVAGITSDRLYPIGLQHELAALLPGRPAGAPDRLRRGPRRVPGGG